MINSKYICLFLFFSLVSIAAFSQDGLPTEEVDVIKSFNARLINAEKVEVKPQLPPLDTTTLRQEYNILTKTILVEYLPPKIRPLSISKDKLQKGYNGYLKLGAGLPNSVYALGTYNFNSGKQFDMGLDVYHYSANNNSKVENQRFGDTELGAHGTYYFDQGFAINGQLGYTSNTVHFYGYNDINEEFDRDIHFDRSDVKQNFATFEGKASIFNGERTEADFNYGAGIQFYFLQDDYAARENGFVIDLSATKWFNGAHPLSIKLITDFTSYKREEKNSLNNFYLQPSYTYHGDRFKVKLGLNLASNEDEFSFFPDIEASANVIEGILGVYAGATGNLQKNSFRNLSDYNPFIQSRVEVKNTKYYDLFGGVKGNAFGIEYNAKIGYKVSDDLAMFLLTDYDAEIARFDVLYDTVSIFYINGTVSAPLFKGLEVIGTISQSVFSPDHQEKAWHLPTTSITASAIYTTEDNKLRFKGDFFLENGVPYKNQNEVAENLNALFDISVGAEYFFTENIGGFIQLNNLANNKRQRWHRYPVMGLNVLAGISARF
ncbi:MAG: hypothetical protein DHS20C18_22900 [Saprospiraceae bacterium]|nr:MAG: hypothetical protein DHS20C18_22900 [Saprospiraceae bacterium]